MKRLKKLIAICLSLIMIFTLLPSSTVFSAASEDVTEEDSTGIVSDSLLDGYTVIVPDETVTVELDAGETEYIAFLPEYTHTYTITSSSDYDTYGYLYDSEFNSITSNDDGGSGTNFLITYTLEAGQVYYFGCRYYSSSISGSYDVTLTFVHEYYMVEPIEVVSATCTEEGSYEYPCTYCDETITETISATGHSYTYEYIAESECVRYTCEACSDTYDSFVQIMGVDETVTVELDAGETEYIAFIPEYTHTYKITSLSDYDTYGYLYDSEFNSITSNDDGGSGTNFLITYTLEAGQVYYFGCRYYSSSRTGSYDVTLTAVHAADYSAEPVVITPATCTEDGVCEYPCLYCDATATDTIWATGHEINYDIEPVIITPVSCTEDGVCEYQCLYCDATITQTIWSVGHSYTYEYISESECVRYTCEACSDTYDSPIQSIGVDATVTVELDAGEMGYIVFVPDYTHVYTITSVADYDTYGYLYDSEFNCITSNDDGGSGSNFLITYTLEAGQVYYFGCRYYSSSRTGSYDVTLTAEHEIDYSVDPVIVVTRACTVDGVYEYTCLNCDEIITVVEDATGHAYESEYYLDGTYVRSSCVNCGYTNETVVQSIYVDVPVTVTLDAGDDEYFSFVPEYTHIYEFTSSADNYTCAYLYDCDFNRIAYVDGYYSDGNFLLSYALEAGQTYYFRCGYYSAAVSGSFDVNLTCLHNFERSVLEEGTCITAGTHLYQCLECEYSYTQEYFASHKDRDRDSLCDICGTMILIQLEVAFVVDTTGSMGDDIDAVKAKMNDILAELDAQGIVYRIALVDYRDFPERGHSYDYPYMVQMDFSDDYDEITDSINALSLGYGGDTNETVYSALIDGLSELNWSASSTKCAIVMGDAPPLDPEPYTGYTLDDAINALRGIETSSGYDPVSRAVSSRTDDSETDSSISAIVEGETICLYSISTSSSTPISQFAALSESTGGRAYSGSSSDTGDIIETIVSTISDDVHIHTYAEAVIENEIAVTCTEDGSYDEVVYCTDCGVELARVTVTVEATGHSESEPARINEIAATCTEDGSYDMVMCCPACSEIFEYGETVVVPAAGHTEADAVVENEVAATCTKDGSYNSVVYCSECGEVISTKTITVPAAGHIEADAVVENEVDATCTEDGSYDLVSYCSVCSEVMSRETKVVPAVGHVEDIILGLPASCTTSGLEDGVKCSVCGVILMEQTEIAATGHSFGEWTVVKEATIVVEGSEERICSVCGERELQSVEKLEYVLGDANNDGKITAADARFALRVAANLEKSTDELLVLADIDGNGKITASDARTILRKSANLE